MTINDMAIRVRKVDTADTRRDKAARSAYNFIRRQVMVDQPSCKEDLAARMWQRYFAMKDAGLLAAPRSTKRILREKLAFWTRVGVDRKAA